MTKLNMDESLRGMLRSGFTPQAIAARANEISEELAGTTKVRKKYMQDTVNYLKALDPDIEITDKDIKDLEVALQDFEAAFKNSEDWYSQSVQKWLKALGY